jgi:hypothetical protein
MYGRVPNGCICSLSFERREIYGVEYKEVEYKEVHWTGKSKQCEEMWRESIQGTSTVAKYRELPYAMNKTC